MKPKHFKIINLFTGIFILLSSGFSQEVKSLDKRKYIAWTVDHMPYHILVEDAIIDYNTLNTLENPRAKKKKKKAIVLKEMLAEDLLIIVQQKKSTKNEIHEMLINSKFGDASKSVVIEEFLDGIELSCFVIISRKQIN